MPKPCPLCQTPLPLDNATCAHCGHTPPPDPAKGPDLLHSPLFFAAVGFWVLFLLGLLVFLAHTPMAAN